MKIIAQGAEAIISTDGSTVVKERPSKGYRNAQLDSQLRRFRTRREAKVLQKLEDLGVAAPRLLSVDDKQMRIEMSHLSGTPLRDVLEEDPRGHSLRLGEIVGALHTADLVHGDLTTSNALVVEGALHLIDFGLSHFSEKIEDKAVELHLVRQALESRHPDVSSVAFDSFLEGYAQGYAGAQDVVDRLLGRVEKRGRNKGK